MPNTAAQNLPNATQSDPRQEVLRQLQGQLGRSVSVAAANAESAAREPNTFSCGVTAIDRLLPGGGLRQGMLVEWLAEHMGCGAATLGLLAAREACRAGGVLVVLDRARMFYPPAAAGWGVDPARLVVVRPRTARDEIWAAVQALRSPVVAAMWMMIDRVHDRDFRRLQLAAEAGRTLGVLVRGASARGQPSWADVRLSVQARQGEKETRRPGAKKGKPNQRTPLSPLLLVSLSHCRGGMAGKSVRIAIDEAAHSVQDVVTHHDTYPLFVVTELGDPAGRSQGA